MAFEMIKKRSTPSERPGTIRLIASPENPARMDPSMPSKGTGVCEGELASRELAGEGLFASMSSAMIRQSGPLGVKSEEQYE